MYSRGNTEIKLLLLYYLSMVLLTSYFKYLLFYGAANNLTYITNNSTLAEEG